METAELNKKIQQLITQETNRNERQKKILNFLFRKMEEVREIERMNKLMEYEGGKYFTAYLAYKSIMRANFQTNLLNNYENMDDYLETINNDVEQLIKDKDLNEEQPTNEQLLQMLGERMGTKEIKSDWERSDYGDDGATCLYLNDEEGKEILRLDLNDGKLTPNQAEEVRKGIID